MSDFDKEAEREKLREKYEQEREDREVAEKMSELLLQGATMTNAHCSDCGDPIFRYDGQEFCATCEKPVDRDTGDGDATDAGGADDDTPSDADARNIEVTSPSEDARVQFGSDGDESADADAGEVEPSPGTESTPDAGRPGATDAPAERPSAEASRPDRAPARERPVVDGAADDVSAARASLVRTLTRFSERAERCEDPGRAREHLAAAREAAEALSALRR